MSEEKRLVLTEDGEIFIPGDEAQSAPTLPAPDKLKRAEFDTPPMTLWARPFPDPAGYDGAWLYLDPDIAGGWRYTVLLRWITGSGQSAATYSKRLYGDGFPDRDSALEAGVNAYKEKVRSVVELDATPHKMTFREFGAVMASVIVLGCTTGALVLLLTVLIHQEISLDTLKLYMVAVLVAAVGFPVILAQAKPDNR